MLRPLTTFKSIESQQDFSKPSLNYTNKSNFHHDQETYEYHVSRVPQSGKHER